MAMVEQGCKFWSEKTMHGSLVFFSRHGAIQGLHNQKANKRKKMSGKVVDQTISMIQSSQRSSAPREETCSRKIWPYGEMPSTSEIEDSSSSSSSSSLSSSSDDERCSAKNSKSSITKESRIWKQSVFFIVSASENKKSCVPEITSGKDNDEVLHFPSKKRKQKRKKDDARACFKLVGHVKFATFTLKRRSHLLPLSNSCTDFENPALSHSFFDFFLD